MKILETARKTVQKAATAVAKVIAPDSRPRNPFYSDEERRAQVNARGAARRAELSDAIDAMGGRSRWIPRRQGWLR